MKKNQGVLEQRDKIKKLNNVEIPGTHNWSLLLNGFGQDLTNLETCLNSGLSSGTRSPNLECTNIFENFTPQSSNSIHNITPM